MTFVSGLGIRAGKHWPHKMPWEAFLSLTLERVCEELVVILL